MEQVVLAEYRRLAQFITRHEDIFKQAVLNHAKATAADSRQEKQRQLKAAERRDAELDDLYQRIYEDRAKGLLPDSRFEKLARNCDIEQAELAEKIKMLKAELAHESAKQMTLDSFTAMVQKYTRARKLTAQMLNELIDRIEVFHAEKIEGVHVQKLRIHYKCIGSIEIPDELHISEPDVTIKTRRGTYRHYAGVDTKLA